MKVNWSLYNFNPATICVFGYAGTKTEVVCLSVLNDNDTTVVYRAADKVIFPSTNIPSPLEFCCIADQINYYIILILCSASTFCSADEHSLLKQMYTVVCNFAWSSMQPHIAIKHTWTQFTLGFWYIAKQINNNSICEA